MTHFIEKCPECKKITAQCRCHSCDKEKRWKICPDCLQKKKPLEEKESKLVGGNIPAYTLCPFNHQCNIPCQIKDKNVHSQPFSCAAARAYDIVERRAK